MRFAFDHVYFQFGDKWRKKMDGNCIMCCTVWVLSCTARHEVHKNFECITSVWRFCWFIFYWQHSKFSNLNWSSSTERKAILVVCYVRKIMPPAFGQYSFHCQIAWHLPMFLYACGEIILIIILCIKLFVVERIGSLFERTRIQFWVHG